MIAQNFLHLWHDQIHVDPHRPPEPLALRAGAERVVEGEQPRLDLVDSEPTDRAGEARGKDDPLALVRRVDIEQSLAEAEGGFHAVGEAGAEVRLWGRAVGAVVELDNGAVVDLALDGPLDAVLVETAGLSAVTAGVDVATISLTLADAAGRTIARIRREVFLKAWRLQDESLR